jgi:predicted HTH domain antitoxin
MKSKEKIHDKESRRLLASKLLLEGIVSVDLIRYFGSLTKYVRAGEALPSIQPVIEGHHNRIKRHLLGNAKVKQEIKERLYDDIDYFLHNKAKYKSSIIDDFTNELLEKSRNEAREELTKEGEALPGDKEVLVVASRILRNRNKGRVATIANDNTQGIVEGMREVIVKRAHTELQTSITEDDKDTAEELYLLSNDYTTYKVSEHMKDGDKEKLWLLAILASATKTWVTMGDNRVRDWHVKADGQTVPINEPFVSGGQLLMYPGDMSLGASLENILNCRCSALY